MRPWLLVAGGILLVTTLAVRLLAVHTGSGFALPGFVTDWGVERFAGNPVIDVDDNPAETTEQYTPAPVRLPNGDIWVYVKGLDRIYAWKSGDDGETFTLENGGAAVLAPIAATWEEAFVVDPAATYDPESDTIHLYYKATDQETGDDNWQWGHATAPGTDPTDVTRDAANPILTEANALSDLGGGTLEDLSLSDVVKIGPTIHFYGYASHSGTYKIVHATGTDWNAPAGLSVLLTAPGGAFTVVQAPSVFYVNGQYAMLYSTGGAQPDPRYIRAARSTNGFDWDFTDTTNIISPEGTGWEEDETYAASVLKDGTGSEPVLIGGKMLLYYSGLETPPGDANVGLIYLDPS